MTVDLPPRPGRAARTARSRSASAGRGRAPAAATARRARAPAGEPAPDVVDAREIDPPAGAPAVHWRLLTTPGRDVADALDIAGLLCGAGRSSSCSALPEVPREGLRHRGRCASPTEPARSWSSPPPRRRHRAPAGAPSATATPAARSGLSPTPSIPRTSRCWRGLPPASRASTERQKNPHPQGSLAFATWVFARLGGWTGYYGKPGPIVILSGWTEFQSFEQSARLAHQIGNDEARDV